MSRRAEIIVALDTASRERAIDLVRSLRGQVSLFKVGMELYTAVGPSIVKDLKSLGAEVFLDLKYHDIPNTVARASAEAARLGVAMLDMHLSGGAAMVRRAVDEVEATCAVNQVRRPALLGITLLTSLGEEAMASLGMHRTPEEQVLALAAIGRESGLDGVVASPREIAPLRARFGPDFLLVTPGIRSEGAAMDDQIRTLTPREAAQAGADYLVIGRPITGAENPAVAAREILRALIF
ncbi:MAG TPA: orotidine-5'-phosphate decarboxylase [Candidatus Polarisedimenticolia bacterium]|jgi:orotidine-5'-phosphate decarboxylase|nr:orotidine-5'-phosphate decarboxylase [Candidatus Polarisedimenticolia bacterium]